MDSFDKIFRNKIGDTFESGEYVNVNFDVSLLKHIREQDKNYYMSGIKPKEYRPKASSMYRSSDMLSDLCQMFPYLPELEVSRMITGFIYLIHEGLRNYGQLHIPCLGTFNLRVVDNIIRKTKNTNMYEHAPSSMDVIFKPSLLLKYGNAPMIDEFTSKVRDEYLETYRLSVMGKYIVLTEDKKIEIQRILFNMWHGVKESPYLANFKFVGYNKYLLFTLANRFMFGIGGDQTRYIDESIVKPEDRDEARPYIERLMHVYYKYRESRAYAARVRWGKGLKEKKSIALSPESVDIVKQQNSVLGDLSLDK